MVFVKVMVFCWFLTKNHKKTIIFPTYGFGMVLINVSCVHFTGSIPQGKCLFTFIICHASVAGNFSKCLQCVYLSHMKKKLIFGFCIKRHSAIFLSCTKEVTSDL